MPTNSERSQQHKKVYLGLPKHLEDRIEWVARDYRTHPLSYEPGGCDIVVEYHNNGLVLGYDWIKDPAAYIQSIFAEMVKYAPAEFKKLDKASKIKIAKSKMACFYTRKLNADAFEEVWNSNTSHDLPWVALRKFYNDEEYDDDDDYYVDPSDAFPDEETYSNWLESTDFDN